MNRLYVDQPISTCSGVGAIMSASSEGFECWPHAQLSEHLLAWAKASIEQLLDGLYNSSTGKMKSAAKRAIEKAESLHPLIRTRWGCVTGQTCKSYDSAKVRCHLVQIHVHKAEALELPEIIDQFGTGEYFNPFADAVTDFLQGFVDNYNAQESRYPVKLTLGENYAVAELSTRYRVAGGIKEESLAFVSLMTFLSGLFSNGTMDRIIEDACNDKVLVNALLEKRHTFRTHRKLRRMPGGGLDNWKGRRYGDLPELSDVAAAEFIYTSGLELKNWPYATMPSAITKPYLQFWRQESMNPKFCDSQEEADEELKRALQVTAEPDAMIRTQWGMLLIVRKEETVDDMRYGEYKVFVHASAAWGRDDDFHLVGGKLEDLLMESTGMLTDRCPDYPIDVEMVVGIGSALVEFTCEFDPVDGEESERNCREALCYYVFLILALGILGKAVERSLRRKEIDHFEA